MTIVGARVITGGVDTRADMPVAAALDRIGGLLGAGEFPVTPAGYAGLLSWLGGFGTVGLAGIEGAGSYRAGLARHARNPGRLAPVTSRPAVMSAATAGPGPTPRAPQGSNRGRQPDQRP